MLPSSVSSDQYSPPYRSSYERNGPASHSGLSLPHFRDHQQLLIGDPGSAGSAKRFGAISPIPFPFNFLRTLLRTRKTQRLLFQEFPHSLPKTTRVGYPYSATPLPRDVERDSDLVFFTSLLLFFGPLQSLRFHAEKK
jgi:hypothetical protein